MTVAPSAARETRPLAFVSATLGLIVALLALPIVLVAGGSAVGWATGFGLWVFNWAAALFITKVALGMPPMVAVGVSGISFIARAWLIAIILFIVALRFDQTVGLTAAGVFIAAFTFDLMGRTLLFSMRERERRHGVTE